MERRMSVDMLSWTLLECWQSQCDYRVLRHRSIRNHVLWNYNIWRCHKQMTQTAHNYFHADHYQVAVTTTCVPLPCRLVSSRSWKCASNDLLFIALLFIALLFIALLFIALLFIALATVWPVRLIYNPGLAVHPQVDGNIRLDTMTSFLCLKRMQCCLCSLCPVSTEMLQGRRLQSQCKHAWHTLIGVISQVYLGVLPAGTRRFH